MNKEGFTLIEVLISIAVIAFLAGVGVMAYSSVIDKSSKETFRRYMDTMHAEAIYYVASNSITWENNQTTLYLTDLNIKPINNPKDASDFCDHTNNRSSVVVTRSHNAISGVLSMTYNVCLRCNDFEECKEYDN